jgi:hypothetical protein
MTYREADSRALEVLARALQSTSWATRLRAVSMLSHVACEQRIGWLEAARADPHTSVSMSAIAVLAWIAEPEGAPWPDREDPSFDRLPDAPCRGNPVLESGPGSRWQWEYVVEIWRDDGLLIGCYVAMTCAEDDEHAKRIALGQAIIANAGGRGDSFDAGAAAAFIVGKRRLDGAGRREGPSRRRA